MRATRIISIILIVSALLALYSCTKLRDDLPAPTSVAVEVHPLGWKDSASANFHGTYLKNRSYNLSTCVSCHGGSYDGGTSGISCFQCHTSYPHATGWKDSTAAGFHGRFIRNSAWDMLQCKACHGGFYEGGRTGLSCLTCHQKPNGPENCTTCHGGVNAAPPSDVNGNTSSSSPGVGAHQPHLLGSALASSIACTECHNVPSTVYQPGHLDNARPANVTFNGPLGTTVSEGGRFVPHPAMNFASLTCTNTFCHGNWKLDKSASPYQFAYADTVMSGNNRSPVWTGGSSQAACGSCHGLPPTGHFATDITRCARCHTGVIDANGNIIDSTLHINGKVNVFGLEYNFVTGPPPVRQF